MKKFIILLILFVGCEKNYDLEQPKQNSKVKKINTKVSSGGDLYCKEVETDWYTVGCSDDNCSISYDYTESKTECYYSRPSYSYAGGYGGKGVGFGGSSNFPPIQNGGLVNKIKQSSTLSPSQFNILNDALEDFITNCLNNQIYKALVAKDFKINFNMDASISSFASFNPNSNTMTFKSTNDIVDYKMAEELFHAYQDSYYDGGTSQYLGTGASNIEFESKVYRDIIASFQGGTFNGQVGQFGDNYRDWIYELTNYGTKFPTTIPIDKYMLYLNNFRTYWSQLGNTLYGSPIITTLFPDALMKAIKSSNCPK